MSLIQHHLLLNESTCHSQTGETMNPINVRSLHGLRSVVEPLRTCHNEQSCDSSSQRELEQMESPSDSREAIASEAGYSLLEIMIVIVIIGILALIAIPKFMGVTTRAKMTEAKTMLRQVYTLQQAHYYERDVYGSTLSAIGFEQSRLVSDGGNARYQIAIETADATTYVATATSVVDYDKDGTMNVWQVGPEGQITERVPD